MLLKSTNGINVLVDDEMYEWLNLNTWHVGVQGYALRNKDLCKMHRLVISAKKGEIVDHIDRNKLNNTTSNLRIVSFSENIHNRGKVPNTINNYKGVKYNPKTKLYESRCRINFEDHHLGSFKTEISAGYAYNKKAKELSEYSILNEFDLTVEELEDILIKDRVLPAYAEKRSNYKDVFWVKKAVRGKCGKWTSFIIIDKQKIYLGKHINEIDANNIRLKAEEIRHLFNGDKLAFTKILNIKNSKLSSKITENQVLAIRRLYKINPCFDKDIIAKKLGIQRQNINSIIARRTWKYI